MVRAFFVALRLFCFCSAGWLEQALFLEGADCLRAEFHFDLVAINDDCFGLKVWLPDFFSVALRKADIAAKLLAFACEFTFLHDNSSNID